MRIIGGEYRSRVLASFKGEEIRPTADRVKESLFNILSPRLRGARVLDLFCGSGALGLESLSRGAREAVFNDLSKDSLLVLRKNIAALGVQSRSAVSHYDYLQCLASLRGTFDVIFLDPPYRTDYAVRAMDVIAARRLLDGAGIIVSERDRPFEDTPPSGLQLVDERKYGKTYLSFFAWCGEGEEKGSPREEKGERK